MRSLFSIGLTLILFGILPVRAADPVKPPTEKEALQPFNLLIGSWKGGGIPEGTPPEKIASRSIPAESSRIGIRIDMKLNPVFGTSESSIQFTRHLFAPGQTFDFIGTSFADVRVTLTRFN